MGWARSVLANACIVLLCLLVIKIYMFCLRGGIVGAENQRPCIVMHLEICCFVNLSVLAKVSGEIQEVQFVFTDATCRRTQSRSCV